MYVRVWCVEGVCEYRYMCDCVCVCCVYDYVPAILPGMPHITALANKERGVTCVCVCVCVCVVCLCSCRARHIALPWPTRVRRHLAKGEGVRE